MRTILLLPLLLLAACASAPKPGQDPRLEKNKATVIAFYDLAFNQHRPAEAMEKYVGKAYKQHNPSVADGKQPFIDFFTPYLKKNPTVHAEVKRAIAEDDLVVVHVWSRMSPGDRGRAVMDIFRLDGGKIVEHWDVGMPIPDKSANGNGMF